MTDDEILSATHARMMAALNQFFPNEKAPEGVYSSGAASSLSSTGEANSWAEQLAESGKPPAAGVY
jgi:hypothetical protein